MTRPLVIAAMSGGVDSAVAAALLKHRGYEVIGVVLRLISDCGRKTTVGQGDKPKVTQSVRDAQKVAGHLGIPLMVLDLQEDFESNVIKPFCQQYAVGLTPNPCVMCNNELKFGLLLEKAISWGARYVGTGHYARINYDRTLKRYKLCRAMDVDKDQSYALYGLSQQQLKHCLFPLGGLTKTETRRLAEHLSLPVAGKRDSQDICFLTDNDYRNFLAKRMPHAIRAGPFVDTSGTRIGTHKGVPFYTIGQRRHLGIASSKRLYVINIDPRRNIIVLGEEDDLQVSRIVVSNVNWVSIEQPEKPFTARIRVRYQGSLYRGLLTPTDSEQVDCCFTHPIRAPSPGQSAVFYRGDEVLGGGIISS